MRTTTCTIGLPAAIILTVAAAPPTRAQVQPPTARRQAQPGPQGQVPAPLAALVQEIKAKTGLAVLLPSALPGRLAGAKHAVLESATKIGYRVVLYFDDGGGVAGFAALFAATSAAKYSPADLGGVRGEQLADGIQGYFRPVSCGGPCAPANIWWEQFGALYQIQLSLPSSTSQQAQRASLTEVANSAILAGPR